MAGPLRSTAVTAASSLLRIPPHPCRTSLLSLLLSTACSFRLSFRHGLLLFPIRAYTMLLPPLRRQPSDQYARSPSDFLPSGRQTLSFDCIYVLSTLHQRFIFIQLHGIHLMGNPHLFTLRSAPWLLTTAPSGGLQPSPD